MNDNNHHNDTNPHVQLYDTLNTVKELNEQIAEASDALSSVKTTVDNLYNKIETLEKDITEMIEKHHNE